MMSPTEREIMSFVQAALRARVRYEEALEDFRNKVINLEESRRNLEGAKSSLENALGRNVLFGSPTILASLEKVRGKQ